MFLVNFGSWPPGRRTGGAPGALHTSALEDWAANFDVDADGPLTDRGAPSPPMIALAVRSGASREPCVHGGSTGALLLLASGPAVPAVLGAGVDCEIDAVGGVGDITLALGPRPGSGGREGPATVCEGFRTSADVLADCCGSTLGRAACNVSLFFGAGAFPPPLHRRARRARPGRHFRLQQTLGLRRLPAERRRTPGLDLLRARLRLHPGRPTLSTQRCGVNVRVTVLARRALALAARILRHAPCGRAPLRRCGPTPALSPVAHAPPSARTRAAS